MDALPVQEKTELPFASTKFITDEFCTRQPVMHACGPDLHMAALLATVATLKNSQKQWHGTALALFQPNGEYTAGAQAMVDDGLYDKITISSVVLGQHIMPLESSVVANQGSVAIPSADALDIRIYGGRGHRVNPQNNIDPIGIAVRTVARLPKLAKQLSTNLPIILGRGGFHAGVPRGDSAAHADLNIGIETYDAENREKGLKAVREVVKREVADAGVEREAAIDARARALIARNSPIMKALQNIFAAHFFKKKPPLNGNENVFVRRILFDHGHS
ncbi:hypothetical protein MMC21_001271 [Puttea exsequens]|nr:hypothetical protein [Puttea exsequens]